MSETTWYALGQYLEERGEWREYHDVQADFPVKKSAGSPVICVIQKKIKQVLHTPASSGVQIVRQQTDFR